MKKDLVLPLILLIFVAIACGGGNQNSDIAKQTPEEMLVFVDTGKRPKTDDTNVKRVRFLLDYLAENTTSSRYEIADHASRTSELIENKYGKKYTGEEILEGARRIVDSIPKEKRGKKDDFKTITYLITMEASTK